MSRLKLKPFIEVPIDLSNYKAFKSHPWICDITSLYKKHCALAKHAVAKLIENFEYINGQYQKKNKRALFVSVDGRVKSEDSFFKKLFNICVKKCESYGISQENLKEYYHSIKDLSGVRFACPYYDDIDFAIKNIIRPKLAEMGYATNLKGDEYVDKNYLDEGDKFGYRSYHFYVKVPTPINIFGAVELFICEIQARTELQHVWAVKSHDLLYKSKKGFLKDENIIEDMRQVSNGLRAADQFFVSIRKRTKRGS